jgi:hypothetical protein
LGNFVLLFDPGDYRLSWLREKPIYEPASTPVTRAIAIRIALRTGQVSHRRLILSQIFATLVSFNRRPTYDLATNTDIPVPSNEFPFAGGRLLAQPARVGNNKL